QRAGIAHAVGDHRNPERLVRRLVAVAAGEHRIDFAREAPLPALRLRQAVAQQPGLVDATQARRAPTCKQAEGHPARHAHRHLLRLARRISRCFFATWRSVRTFFLSLYGLSPSLNTKRTGVPTS